MQYIIKIIYLDDKDLSVILDEKEVSKFNECIRDNKPYWNINNSQAIWTPKDQIRYINIFKQEAVNDSTTNASVSSDNSDNINPSSSNSDSPDIAGNTN